MGGLGWERFTRAPEDNFTPRHRDTEGTDGDEQEGTGATENEQKETKETKKKRMGQKMTRKFPAAERLVLVTVAFTPWYRNHENEM